PEKLVVELNQEGTAYDLLDGAQSPDAKTMDVIAAVLARRPDSTADDVRVNWPPGRAMPQTRTIQNNLSKGAKQKPPRWLKSGPGGRSGFRYPLAEKYPAKCPEGENSQGEISPGDVSHQGVTKYPAAQPPGEESAGSFGPDVETPFDGEKGSEG